MFGFGKKKEDTSARTRTNIIEGFIRQEGAWVTLKRLVEMGLVSREDAIKVWKQADKERRRHWKAKQPEAVVLGPLSIEDIFESDDDDD